MRKNIALSRQKRQGIPRVMLLVETSRAYGRALVEGIGRYIREHGPWSVYFEERGLNDALPSWLRQWQGEGIICRLPDRASIARLRRIGVPIVDLWSDPSDGLPCVYADELAIARMAADHLVQRGLHKFAFFATDHQAWWVAQRRKVFTEELHRRGLACDCFVPPKGRDRPWESERQCVVRWARSLEKPCGVFCASDFHAARLIDACRSAGIRVPEEVAVLGVDNDSVFCNVTTPPLSSVDLGGTRIGYEAAGLLDRLMAAGRPAGRQGGSPVDSRSAGPRFSVAVHGATAAAAEKHDSPARRHVRPADACQVSLAPAHVESRQSTDILAIADAEVAQAVRFIRERACGGADVAEVAEDVALSRRTLERRFERHVGHTPKREILRVRMERAKMLLRQTDLAVEAVCRRSGFASFKYFARAFRREVGITPREFRRSGREP